MWHNRLVQANFSVLRSLSQYAKSFPVLRGNILPCHPCLQCIATNKSFNSKFEGAKHQGEVVFSDVCGKFPRSNSGLKYFITFLDRYSRLMCVAAVKHKSDAEDAVEEYKRNSYVLKHFPKGVQRIHSDGGGEYFNINLSDPTTTTPYTPQHNPFEERIRLTILDPIRVVLEQVRLSAHYWDRALWYVAYMKNRLPHYAITISP